MRVFAIRTDVDYRIGRIVVYVGNGRINLLNTHRASFAAGDFSGPSCIIRVTGGGDSHIPGKVYSVIESHTRSRFEVRGNQQRILRQILHAVYNHDRLVNRPAKQNDSAHVIVDDLMTQQLKRFAVLVEERGIDTDGD